MRRVVVTGLGLVAPTGNDVESAWQAALAARSGVGPITLFDASQYPVRIAAEVKNFEIGDDLDKKEANRVTRFVQFSVKAAREALRNSGLDMKSDTDSWGVSIGVGIGGMPDIEENVTILNERGPSRISPFFLPYTISNMAAGVVSRLNNLRGPNICTATACTSGTHAIGESFLYIATGMADVMVCGGAEAAICRLGVASFASMKALSTRNDDPGRASRPFDRDRDGFIMGEGSGLLVLEEYEHAKKRGATIYAELAGYGMSADAHHITAPAPEGEGAQRCMKMALRSGNINVSEVDYINAHGTSTKMNDAYESMAIMKVFGDQAKNIAVSSTKGVTGHCLGAAGGIEAVYTALAIHRKVIPPTANYEHADPDCPLDYVPNTAREKPIRIALSNSFGFGGTNGTIALRKI